MDGMGEFPLTGEWLLKLANSLQFLSLRTGERFHNLNYFHPILKIGSQIFFLFGGSRITEWFVIDLNITFLFTKNKKATRKAHVEQYNNLADLFNFFFTEKYCIVLTLKKVSRHYILTLCLKWKKI